jgi:hypothetical protein
MSFGMVFNQDQLDDALRASLSSRAWAATERANQLTNNAAAGSYLVGNGQAGPDPNAVLELGRSSLAFNYADGRSQAPGHSFDRPQRNRRRTTRNRGEATHAFDQSEPQPGGTASRGMCCMPTWGHSPIRVRDNPPGKSARPLYRALIGIRSGSFLVDFVASCQVGG